MVTIFRGDMCPLTQPRLRDKPACHLPRLMGQFLSNLLLCNLLGDLAIGWYVGLSSNSAPC